MSDNYHVSEEKDPELERLVAEFGALFREPISIENIHQAVFAAMALVERQKTYSGAKKKALVILIIQDINTRDEWDYIVPSVVEAVHFASKNRKDLKLIGGAIKRRCC